MTALTNDEMRLVKAAREGNQEAFASLIHGHGRKVYVLALRILRCPEDAEEVVQESLWKAYAKLEQFQGQSRFSTWLTRIAVNEALMRLRRSPAREQTSLEELTSARSENSAPLEVRDPADDPEATCASNELQEKVQEAVAALQPSYRSVVLLRIFQEFTTAETAQMLGLSPTGVKTRLRRGRLMLRQRLQSLGAGPSRTRCRGRQRALIPL